MAATQRSQIVKSPQLTDRQMDCAVLAARGMTSKEIARQLNISPSTVDTHLSTVLARCNLKKRSEISMFFDECVAIPAEEKLVLHEAHGENEQIGQNVADVRVTGSLLFGASPRFAIEGQALERFVFAATMVFLVYYLKY